MNNEDLKNATGDYDFQYLFNQAPMYIRKTYSYPYPQFMLWYADGEWRLKTKDTHCGEWSKGKILLRKKTESEFFKNFLIDLLYF